MVQPRQVDDSALCDAEYGDEFANRSRRFIQRGFFLRSKFDLDDLLDASRPKFYRNTDIKSLNAVFALEVGGAGQDLLLVLQNRFDHLDDRGGRRVIRGAGLEQVYNFRASL